MSGNSLVSEDWPRIFNRRANIKVLRLPVVSRNKIETSWVFVVGAWRIHEAARAGWLKRLRQLPNLKRAQVIGQGDEVVFFQKVNHLCFTTLIGLEKRRLIGRNVRATSRIGIGQFRIGQKRLQRAITRQL